MKILLVEDDLDLSNALSKVLAPLGFRLVCCADGLEALVLARRDRFDAIVLDLGLPGLDGLEVIERLRDGASTTPVLVVTARGATEDKVTGLNIGADDYLAKPFDLNELQARLMALIRRSHREYEPTCGSLRLAPKTGLFYNGLRPLDMPPREAALLKCLMWQRGEVVTKEALREAVFGNDTETSTDAIEVLVYRVRKRIAGSAAEVMTLRGVGYLLIDEAIVDRDDGGA
jgi:two-component system response regulator TctD